MLIIKSSLLVGIAATLIATISSVSAGNPSAQCNGYMGCYSDNPVFPELVQEVVYAPSVDKCVEACADKQYTFAAMQDKKCLCGNSYNSQSPSQSCTVTCDGLECGGNQAYSVYSVAAYDLEERPSDYLGCWIDAGDRAMENVYTWWKDDLTLTECKTVCKEREYYFAGVQVGKQCFCGNSYSKYGRGASCSYECPAGEECGGHWGNSVYETGYVYVSPSEGLPGYLGCWKDSSTSIFPYLLQDVSDGKEKAENCVAGCKGMSFAYAAIRGGKCMCGDTYNTLGESSDCMLTCQDGLECGGDMANSVYETASFVSDNTDPDYVGCYGDADDRAMIKHVVTWWDNTLTLQACKDACFDAGFKYAGVQVGALCFCDDTYDKHGFAAGCSSSCLGGGDGECGGPWSNSVYETGVEEAALAASNNVPGYVGCWADSETSIFPKVLQTVVERASVENCVAGCAELNYDYAALQNENTCLCGDSYDTVGPSQDCIMVCQDDSLQCGGVLANSVYETATFVQSTRPEGYVGCYTDAGTRAMPHAHTWWTAGLTIQDCKDACLAAGYMYAGIQIAHQCFCGNEYDRYGPAASCSYDCPDGGECGGHWGNSVYETGWTYVSPSASLPGYLGCYKDSDPSIFTKELQVVVDRASAEKCVEGCGKLGFDYAAMHDKLTCLCGDEYDTIESSDDCQLECADGLECGAESANSVYATETFVPSERPSDYLGCWMDAGSRAMGYTHTWWDDFTLQECKDACLAAGFKYAGVQVGHQCFCGFEYDKYGPAASCSYECEGGGECGGHWGNSVYETGWVSRSESASGFLGCWKDSETSIFPTLVQDVVDKPSAEKCVEACLDLGFPYAALQQNQCRCGDKYDTLGSSTDCTVYCEDGYDCGGVLANSVYDTATFVQSARPDDYVGCFIDGGTRALRHVHTWWQNDLTVDLCKQECYDAGYMYAGLQVGAQCFCGNTYDKYGRGASCSYKCSGGGDGECGGHWGNSVYRTGRDKAACLATGWGDPHVITWDGFHYDVHALGELIFVTSRDTDFEIQARLTAVPINGSPAVTSGVVVKPADANIPKVQISLASETSVNTQHINHHCFVQMYVDETPLPIDDGTQSADVTVVRNGNSITVTYPEQNLRLDMDVVVWSDTCHFSIDYVLLDCGGDDELIGILGSPDGNSANEWMDREGNPLPIPEGASSFFFEPAYTYSVENWCIRDPERSEFTYEPGTDFYTFAKCGNAYDPTLEHIVEEVLNNEDDPTHQGCGENVGCVIEGLAHGTEAIEAFKENPDTEDVPGTTPGDTPPNPPPSPSGSNGDPHFRTWKNEHFEYHGQCDLVLAKDPDFANGLGMEVQIRTKLVRFWSYIKSAAIRIGEDILEVQGQANPEKDVAMYWMNLEPQGELSTIGGFPVTLSISDARKRKFVIDLDSKFPGEKIEISTYREFVKVDFINSSEASFGKSVGMLGNFKTGETLARDGVKVLDDFTQLGNEWQVLPYEDMLFNSVEHPQFPKKCMIPEDPQGERRRRLGESSVSVEQAEAACASLTDELDRKDCIYDVLATQDLDMVGAF